MNDSDRIDLAIQDLRGRIMALTEGRTFLPRWIAVDAVLQVIDEWEADFGEDPVSFETRATYAMIDVPVIDGVATLPDGRTVTSTAQIVRVPVLVESDVPA